MESNPYSAPSTDVGASEDTTSAVEMVRPLYNSRAWMKLIAIVNIVLGALYCLTIVGIVVGWIPIWLGILLNKAASNLTEGVERRSPEAIREAMSNLGTIAVICGVLTILWIALMAVYVVFILIMVFSFSATVPQ